jgi:hypothetical protein
MNKMPNKQICFQEDFTVSMSIDATKLHLFLWWRYAASDHGTAEKCLKAQLRLQAEGFPILSIFIFIRDKIINVAVFWGTTPCNLLGAYQRFQAA